MSELFNIYTPELEILTQDDTSYRALLIDGVGRAHLIEGEYTIESRNFEPHIRHLSAFNTQTGLEYKDKVLKLIGAELMNTNHTQELLEQGEEQ